MDISLLGAPDILYLLVFAWLAVFIYSKYRSGRSATTPLRGPESPSWMWGATRLLHQSNDAASIFEGWANEYGHVFEVPGILGTRHIRLCDPKALAHFYSKETWTYVQTAFAKVFIGTFFGRGLLWSEGESHRRQRKSLTPAFSNASIRRLTSVFYDSSYKCKAVWDAMLESHPEGVVINVQQWMNNIALDSIGIAGFSHNFGQLDGKNSDVAVAFNSFGGGELGLFSSFIFLLSPYFPFLATLPTKRNRVMSKLRKSLGEISDELLERTRKASVDGGEEKSIIGLLIKAENADSELKLSQEEVLAQMNTLLLAGYETTSISLTWALIELTKYQDRQNKLRKELLSQFPSSDPTWEQLMTSIPYLDAVVHEVLRLHPPLAATTRKAGEDDIIPLSTPIVTRTGQTVTSISVAKGTTVTAPIEVMNKAQWIWGPDAKEFNPERWLEPGFGEKNEVQGHRHLLTFVDGPRTCLGKNFALSEFKAALSVIIRNFTFEFDGPEPKIETHLSVLPRPKFAGEDGPKVPLRVRRVE